MMTKVGKHYRAKRDKSKYYKHIFLVLDYILYDFIKFS